MIPQLTLVCGCIVELRLPPEVLHKLRAEMQGEGVIVHTCPYHSPPPRLHVPLLKVFVTELN